MNRKIVLIIVLLMQPHFTIHAQSLDGRWQSSDGKRVYCIYTEDGKLNGILEQSVIPEDSTGKKILLSLTEKRGKYRGWIASPQDEDSIRTNVRLATPDILQITVHHMLLLPVKIRWYRLQAISDSLPVAAKPSADSL